MKAEPEIRNLLKVIEMGLQNTPKLAKIGGALDPGRLSRSGQIRSILSRPPGFGQSFEWWEGAPPFGMVVRLRSAPWASVGFSAWAGSAPGAPRPPLRQPTPKIRLKPTPLHSALPPSRKAPLLPTTQKIGQIPPDLAKMLRIWPPLGQTARIYIISTWESLTIGEILQN